MSDAGEDRYEAGSPSRTTGTGGWVYLGVLSVVAVVLAIAAVASDGAGGRPRGLPGVVEPVQLVLRVDGSEVDLEGRVPDDDVRQGLVELARARYGTTNVADELVLDERTTLDGGAVAVIGSTGDGDPKPLGLQADIASALVLRSGPVQLEIAPGGDDGPPPVAMVPAGRG